MSSKFNKLDNNTYQINHENNFVVLFNNINFFDIQYLLLNSDLLISCHGAITNVAAALNIKIFDIIDPSEDLLFEKYTAHFRNYTSFKRANFSTLAEDIISKLS